MLQMNSDGNKIKENKYKILRMSLLLGNGEDRDETINNFEDAARDIDAMNDEVYLKDLDSKLYDTFKLEEEEKKLSDLVDYIGGRVEQRKSLIEDFANVTGYELSNLPIIKYQDRLDEYKSRLRYIKEYLGNNERISKLNEEVNALEGKLSDGYAKKAKAEEKNLKSEEDLFSRFKSIISHIDLFKDVNSDNVDSKLNDVVTVTDESKKSLDIFNKSFSTLNQAGISGDERNEYLSYVNGAKAVYYENKEKEYLLRIYSLLNTKESDYNDIIAKREQINSLISERLSLRDELNISDNDVLGGLYDLLNKQFEEIKDERINIDNIDRYIQEIDSKKMEIAGLEKDNQKVEILALLKEYCIIDTYEGEKDNTVTTEVEEAPKKEEESDDIFANVPLTNELPKFGENPVPEEEKPVPQEEVVPEEEVKEDVLDTSDATDNQVVAITEAIGMDIASATSKSNSVMKRVGEMLGVKVEISEDVKEPVLQEKETSVPEEVNPFPEEVSPIPEEVTPVPEEKKEDESSISIEDFGITGDIFDNKNYDADPETKEENASESTPLENPLFNNGLGNSTLDEVMANNNVDESKIDGDFWLSNEEKPLDLNSLPDLSNENNEFFEDKKDNNSMPSFDFPDLDASGLNDEEGK